MATAYIEEPRATRYRQRLAALLRRPSCRWISFAIGTAPIHRDFFPDTAASIEGLPTGGVREWNGVSHRQVQYGVRLRVLDGAGRATYDAERDLLVVPEEAEFDSVDGQARLLSACVHVGLAMKGRNLQWLDSECAARIAGQLYRLFETIGDGNGDAEVADEDREAGAAVAAGQGVLRRRHRDPAAPPHDLARQHARPSRARARQLHEDHPRRPPRSPA